MFRNAEYIYAVYKTGSFSAAAKSMYLTQPCLSAMVKKVEQQLGVTIFDRNSKPLQLTEYGKYYISYIEKVWDLERELEQYLNDIRGLRTGTLSIGTNHIFASYVLPPLIRYFNNCYPGVRVQMVEGSISFLEQGLQQGTLDLVLDNCPMDINLCNQYHLTPENLLLAVDGFLCDSLDAEHLTHKDILNGKHLRSDAPSISISAFERIPFIALRKGNDARLRLDQICEDAGITPLVQIEVDQLATAYNIACNGLGATLVSDTLLYKTEPCLHVRYYKLDTDKSQRGVYLYHKRSRYVTKAMQEFMDTAVNALSEGLRHEMEYPINIC